MASNRYTREREQERPIRGVKQVTRHAQGDRASAAAAARPESIRPSHSFEYMTLQSAHLRDCSDDRM